MKDDHRSYIRNFHSCEKKAWIFNENGTSYNP